MRRVCCVGPKVYVDAKLNVRFVGEDFLDVEGVVSVWWWRRFWDEFSKPVKKVFRKGLIFHRSEYKGFVLEVSTLLLSLAYDARDYLKKLKPFKQTYEYVFDAIFRECDLRLKWFEKWVDKVFEVSLEEFRRSFVEGNKMVLRELEEIDF